MNIISGSYVGNGADNRSIVGIGFAPEFVMVRKATGAETCIRATGFAAGYSKVTDNGTLVTDNIQALEADGFQVGTDIRVNQNGSTYFYLAMAQGGDVGHFKVLSYEGQMTTKDVTGVGFQPDVVMVMDIDYNNRVCWRHKDHPGQGCGWATASNEAINAFLADGFRVGVTAATNWDGHTYVALCMKELAGQLDCPSYAGNDADNRSISGVGFQPTAGWTQPRSEWPTRWGAVRFSAETGDNSMRMNNAGGEAANYLQAFESDGFQVGTSEFVNLSGLTYYAVMVRGSQNKLGLDFKLVIA